MTAFGDHNPAFVEAREIVRTLDAAGYRALLAGGCVRDRLLGRPVNDFDIATDAPPEAVTGLFRRTFEKGKQFGVVSVMVGRREFEVAMFRREGPYLDGRRPSSVEPAGPEEDARRRDFTINGMFYDPLREELIDYVGGRDDLKAHLIRAIGDPYERFNEDKLRLMRAVRFACVLKMEIEPATLKAIGAMADRLRMVSAERIRDEFLKLLLAPDRARGMEQLRETGLLEQFLPEALEMIGVEQGKTYHPEGDVWTHTLLVLRNLENPSVELALGALLHDIAKPRTASRDEKGLHFYQHENLGAELAHEIGRRLKLGTKTIKTVEALVADHLRFLNIFKMKISTLKRLLLAPHSEELLALHKADALGSNGDLQYWEYACRKREEFLAEGPGLPPPLVRGRDLIERGYAPGPGLGRILRELHELQLDGSIRSKEAGLVWALEHWPPDAEPDGGPAGPT